LNKKRPTMRGSNPRLHQKITRKTALQDPDGPTAGDVGISVVVETRREIEDLTGVKAAYPGR
jgi:hypothetical protein